MHSNFIARILLWAFIINCGSSLPAQSDTVIVNDTVWKDTDGNEVVAGFGGHITKVGDTYYWVGTDPRPTDGSVRMYSSRTLGSSTWKLETMVEKRKPGLGRRNCTLIHCPTTDRFVIVSKGIGFYQSEGSDVKGPYQYVKKIGEEMLKSKNFHSGGMSVYTEGSKAYLIISMRQLDESRDRYCLICELTPDFMGVEKEILWMKVDDRREAFWLFKRENKYYMTYDGPGGWMGSDCYYRTSESLAGPWTEEKEIGMDPEPKRRQDRSHASQHRYIMNTDGQWIYGGDRYPYQEPESHPPENGSHIICPIIWKGDHPTVKWEKEWNIAAYGGPQSKTVSGQL